MAGNAAFPPGMWLVEQRLLLSSSPPGKLAQPCLVTLQPPSSKAQVQVVVLWFLGPLTTERPVWVSAWCSHFCSLLVKLVDASIQDG